MYKQKLLKLAKVYLEPNKNRINENKIDNNFTYKEARENFLKSFFASNSKNFDQLTIKENILNSLRIMFAKKFGLRSNQIKFNLKKMSSAAGIEELRGDGIFRINIDEESFIKYSKLEVAVTICHEFGHLRQMLNALEGEKVYDIISCDFESLNNENWWQKKGRQFKYEANINEYQANVYACKVVLNCVKYFEQQHGKTEESENAKQILIESLVMLKKEKNKNEKLLQLWEVANKIGRIEDKTHCTYQSPAYGLAEYALENVAHNLLSEKNISPEQATNVLKKCGEIEYPLTISSEKKDDIIEKWSDYVRVITADAFNVSPDEIGFILVDVEDDGFINLRQIDKNNPLFGYYIFNSETVDKLSLKDIYKQLMIMMNDTIQIATKTEEKE